MATTYIDTKKVNTWFNAGGQVSKAYLDGKLVYDQANNTEKVIAITADYYNANATWVQNLITAACGGIPANGATIRFIITAGVSVVANSTSEVFAIDGSWWSNILSTCAIIIENHGNILGRGGQGGDSNPGWETGGRNGGDALSIANMTVVIDNYGTIGGGGGGGGATGWYYGGSGNYNSTGGGGAPFGAAGNNTGTDNRWYGSAGSLTSGGGGGGFGPAGSGGNWGQPGGNGTHKSAGTSVLQTNYGGAAGNAIRMKTGGAITWLNNGTIAGTIGA